MVGGCWEVSGARCRAVSPCEEISRHMTLQPHAVKVLFLALAVFLAALALNRCLAPAHAVKPATVNIEVLGKPRVQVGAEPVAWQSDSRRSAVRPQGMVSIAVKNVEGRPVEAQVAWQDTGMVVRGESWIPARVGTVTVTAPGYRSHSLDVADQDVEVVLTPVYHLDVRVVDVATEHPIAGVALSLEDSERKSAALLGVTNREGECSFKEVLAGRYMLFGELLGYASFASGSAAMKPGIAVDVGADLRISVAMSPIYVALCAVNNSTNLEDEVLRSLLLCKFRQQPGSNLPQWLDVDLTNRIAAVADSMGLIHAYGQSCLLTTAPTSLMGQVDFTLRGTGPVASFDVGFQPFAEFVNAPGVTWHSLDGQWEVAELTVECPIDMRICVKSGMVFGGLTTKAGSFTCHLPHGSYIVGPQDAHPLLDAAKWTREVQIPGVSHVSIAPPEGFGTLEIVGGDQWPRGVLCFSGAGFTMGIPLKNLPVTMPVSPGSFDFRVLLSPDVPGPAVWQETVAIQAGQRRILTVRGE